mmetsp:Transcript_32464/g.66088  ORF Transcript_32464/g.66088 Transcript_32464/m.66088 type:complete len:211 (+) Transcript_32464:65-697(+)
MLIISNNAEASRMQINISYVFNHSVDTTYYRQHLLQQAETVDAPTLHHYSGKRLRKAFLVTFCPPALLSSISTAAADILRRADVICGRSISANGRCKWFSLGADVFVSSSFIDAAFTIRFRLGSTLILVHEFFLLAVCVDIFKPVDNSTLHVIILARRGSVSGTLQCRIWFDCDYQVISVIIVTTHATIRARIVRTIHQIRTHSLDCSLG